MGNGKWQVANGKWQIGNGKWEMMISFSHSQFAILIFQFSICNLQFLSDK
jgi:hypothetical protein